MSKIPQFANEQEEAESWANHDAAELLDETEPEQVVFVAALPPKTQTSLRLDPITIDLIHGFGQR